MDTPTVTPLQSALGRHAESLLPAAREQLSSLWQAEFESLPPSVVGDLVDARLSKPEFSHFKKPADGKAPAQQQQQQQQQPPAPIVGVAGPRAAQMVAGMERMDEQFKAAIGAARQSASPGLTGTYSPV